MREEKLSAQKEMDELQIMISTAALGSPPAQRLLAQSEQEKATLNEQIEQLQVALRYVFSPHSLCY